MGRGVNIPWVGGQNTMGRGVDIPSLRGSICHGQGGQNTMGREGVQYILIIMGRGVIQLQNFHQKKKSKFSKKFKISKIL